MNEKKAAAKEFEEKKIELRENLISDLEEKRKIIEAERHTMELTGDSMEVIFMIIQQLFQYSYLLKNSCSRYMRLN